MKMRSKLVREFPIFVMIGFLLLLNLSVISFAQNNPNDSDNEKGSVSGQYPVEVQLLAVNDFHGQLDTVKCINGRDAGGADYLAAYLRHYRDENPNTLLLHAGDMVGGSAPSSALFQDVPTMEFMNQMAFDAGIPGNHELDGGVHQMMRLINGGDFKHSGYFTGASFPYLSANMIDPSTGDYIFKPYLIQTVKRIPIGIIGVTLGDLSVYQNPEGLKEVAFTDEISAVNHAVAELKAKNVETVILLAHIDGSPGKDGKGVTGALAELADQVSDEVDVIIAGHSHTAINCFSDGKLIVEALSGGTAFSEIHLEIDPVTQDVLTKKASLVITYHDAMQPDRKISDLITKYSSKVKEEIDLGITRSDNAIKKKPNAAGESALGNLIADAYRWKLGTDIAFTNTTGIRSDLGPGIVTWGELYTIQPFQNGLVTMSLTGQQILDILNQQFQTGKILQVSGLRYTWSNDQVKEIYLTPSQVPIDPDQIYSVAVNHFLAGGGDGFTEIKNGTALESGSFDLDSCIEYLKQLPQPVSAAIEGRIIKTP